MRKITKEITDAFFARRSRKCGNTRTDGTTIWLHGNAIAQWQLGELFITLAGWDTVTTRERLNGIGRRAAFSVFRDRGVTKVNVYDRGDDFRLVWKDAVEMPTSTWINPRTFVGQFADK